MSYTINIQRTIPLSVDETFALLSDHNRLGAVLGIPVKRTRDGDTELNGLGSVRTMGMWPVEFDETVTGFEPNQRIDYKITRGTPLRNHRGTVAFEAAGERSTKIIWDIEYDVGVPLLGTVIKHGLGFGIGRGLSKIGR